MTDQGTAAVGDLDAIMAEHADCQEGDCCRCVSVDDEQHCLTYRLAERARDAEAKITFVDDHEVCTEQLRQAIDQAEARGIEAAMAKDAVDALNEDLRDAEAKLAEVRAAIYRTHSALEMRTAVNAALGGDHEQPKPALCGASAGPDRPTWIPCMLPAGHDSRAGHWSTSGCAGGQVRWDDDRG